MMTILMVRPAAFAYNAQTAVNNTFQHKEANIAGLNELAQQEFDDFVALLRKHHIDIMLLQDSPDPHTPDSIFPNNWMSCHHDGSLVLYPMYAANRRLERSKGVLNAVQRRFGIRRLVDFTAYEAENRFLEGTGSMVLDRVNRIAYACISPRTDPSLFENFCQEMHYRPVLFAAYNQQGHAIYHTNVLMCVADRYVVIHEACIPEQDRARLRQIILQSGKAILPITAEQMQYFAGNMLQVISKHGVQYLVMSSQAWWSLTADQQEELMQYNPIIHSDLQHIERNGGGSARCMMAEIYLNKL